MREGVTSRMVADVPLGAFLSGGVDSSGVVALMAEASPRAVRTCTIGFEEAGHDERGYARTIAQRFATDHVERVVRADDFALMDTLVAHFDEPFADASALATYRLCQLAREHVTVALSGDGADEAMAGYRRHVFHAGEERVRGLFPADLRSHVFGTLGRVYPRRTGRRVRCARRRRCWRWEWTGRKPMRDRSVSRTPISEPGSSRWRRRRRWAATGRRTAMSLRCVTHPPAMRSIGRNMPT